MVETLIERIKNTIQDANINLLLGSGLSSPFLTTLGNIESLLTECAFASMSDDARKIISASLYQRYFTEVISKNLLIVKSEPAAKPKTQ